MNVERGDFRDMDIGWPVFTSDGDRIGDVKDVRGGFFKVSAAAQPDYWLSTSHISSESSDRVVLDCDKRHLDEYKTESPIERAA